MFFFAACGKFVETIFTPRLYAPRHLESLDSTTSKAPNKNFTLRFFSYLAVLRIYRSTEYSVQEEIADYVPSLDQRLAG